MDPTKPITDSLDQQDDLQLVLNNLTSGKHLDTEVLRRVRERARKIRQETYERHGILKVAVELIRETRDDA